jgi:glycosyltransferase involved in cell wall biosynthesis
MPYLKELLVSLSIQDLDQGLYEVIAVDDGSTDSSGLVLDEYASKHPNFRVIHQSNSGWPGQPRNIGVEASHAPYIFFCDADDVLGPEALRRMLDFAGAHDVDVLVPKLIGLNGRGVMTQLFSTTEIDVDRRKILGSLSPQKLIRRSLLDNHAIRFREDKVRLEDGMVIAKCYLLADTVSVVSDYDYYFLRARNDGMNISSQRTDPEGYTQSVADIAKIIQECEPSKERADRMVLDLFQRKCLRIYDQQRFRLLSKRRKKRWVNAHADFLDRFIAPDVEAELSADHRNKCRLLRERDVNGLELVVTEPALSPNVQVHAVELNPDMIELELMFSCSTNYDQAECVVRRRGGATEVRFPLTAVKSGPNHFRVLIRPENLAAFGNTVVDAFVQVGTRGVLGPERRLAAGAHLQLPVLGFGLKAYATGAGNFSLDLGYAR